MDPRRGAIVKNQEIADSFHLERGFGVVAILQPLAHVAVGQHLDEPCDARLDQVDARRFERLEEAARETQRDAIARPHSFAAPRHESQDTRFGERSPIQVG
jgi:hypothetical protein